jgi:hypothetical protein
MSGNLLLNPKKKPSWRVVRIVENALHELLVRANHFFKMGKLSFNPEPTATVFSP